MIKAISYWSVSGGLQGARPVEAAMAEAKAAGFAAIELCFAEAGVLTPHTDQPTCTRYRQAAEQQGLALQTVASGISWGCSPTDPDAGVRARSIQVQGEALQRAAWLGCKSMLFVPGAVSIPWNPSYAPVRYDRAVEWAREACRALGGVAERVGVELCIENVWNGLFYSPLELAAFVDSIGSAAVGVYFDAGNVLGYHQHPPHWIEILGRRIKRVHVKDYKKEPGGLAGFCELLEGDVPWKQTVEALRSIGYDRTVVAEMMPPGKGLLARTSKALDAVLAM